MANKSQNVAKDLTFVGGAKPKGVPPSTESGEVVEHDQLQDAISHKIHAFTVDLNGLSSTYTAEHNLGRFIAFARVYQPDGEVAQVEVQNKDNDGNVSQNIAQVISSVPMLGTLTLI